ncbi:hypothetical protein WJX72_008628 [[Myrmecia] bisecta]|uniref:Small ribosomal subunit protein uS15c n=1 Tax=[Myrmecia] bisecta TaxID=41462 RepID=A0AAW1PPY2_9CHLO
MLIAESASPMRAARQLDAPAPVLTAPMQRLQGLSSCSGSGGSCLPQLMPAHAFSTTGALFRFRRPAEAITRPQEAEVDVPKPDLVQQFLSADLMSRAELNKLHLRRVMEDIQRFEGDTGSSEVQVARLTEKIKLMAQHMAVHRKDYHSRRGLEAMLHQRRKLLQYLRRTDFDTYSMLLARLGLKDNYGVQNRLMRSKVGSSSGASKKSK